MTPTASTSHVSARLILLVLAATAAIFLVGGAVAARRQRAEIVMRHPGLPEAPRAPVEQKFPRELVS